MSIVPQGEVAWESGGGSFLYSQLMTTNYTSWVIRMQAMMKDQGVWEAVAPAVGEAVHEKKDKKARSHLFQALMEDLLIILSVSSTVCFTPLNMSSENNKDKEVSLPTPVVAVPLSMVPPANLPVPQQLGNNRSLYLKGIMQHCVAALAMGNIVAANIALQAMSTVASADGDSLQPVAFAFAEALARRVMQPLLGLSWALQLQVPRPPTPAHTDAAQQNFFKLCPLIRLAATAANLAILEAMEAECHVHVVDLGGANPNQWLHLLRLFAARSGGPPSMRLTVVNEQDEFLSRAAGLLTQEAVRLHVPFVFNPVRSHIDRFFAPSVAALRVEHNQALVITSTLQLHRLIADVVTIELPAKKGKKKKPEQTTTTLHQITKADALLRVLCDLSPKLMVLTEQEADHNCAVLWDRARNAFDYYAELFRDLEAGGATTTSGSLVLLREEIMDIVAGDGVSRRERHEKMVRWTLRMREAGFEPAQMSVNAFVQTLRLAQQLSSDGKLTMYGARKANGCFFLYSRAIPMFSVSAWRPARRTSE
ncbi:scarecrow-like protein 3 [Phragmites australis]|uniref:scarecrow-like protein 3 n=1 Tax=Phragmites australis TaxID=29695 RepID=UPI002D7A2FB3|nr:scarecrow-like protein 3 [Phragmites australis]